MKGIVIGSSLSGKTSLIKYFRKNTNLQVQEIDEEIKDRSGGKWPTDDVYRFKVLGQKIIDDALGSDDIIFFTNTDYFTDNNLKVARKKGFKVIQLYLDLDELEKRNKYRIKYEGYDDFSKWLKSMLGYQERIKSEGHVDKIIAANKPVEKIAKEIVVALNAK